ncbi:5,6-dimethylbenzimidazole synthase [Terriglobus sp. 2YAB30_2]|uniref:5,6-dimethylbenzimidazole synthase n=1 Tax=Terriglobus sp. 2YAB30_2 TaxID=3233023 RepID=UPI003F99CA1F
MVESLVMPEDLSFSDADRSAVYRAIALRRDVRRGFLNDPLPEKLLDRLLAAAHHAPSVGFMQPSRFIVIRNRAIRQTVYDIFKDANAEARERYDGDRKKQYDSLKLEGILEAPLNICIVCDTQSQRGHGLGRLSMPETAAYSTVCAVQNLWLAARAEGVGVGWVSILDPVRLRAVLRIPDHILPVAYLCIGYVDEFGSQPELQLSGWEKRVPMETTVFYDAYDAGAQP